jgi:outer membrane protein, heavy metal efflux system
MRRFAGVCSLAVLAGLGGLSVHADPPASSPDGVAPRETAQSQSTVPVPPANPSDSSPTRWRLFQGFIRAKQAPPARERAREIKPPVGDRNQARSQPNLTGPTAVSRPAERRVTSGIYDDARLRRVQATPGDMSMPIAPGPAPLPPSAAGLPTTTPALMGGQSISLQAALYGALTSNPDLVTMRQGNALAVSAESVEVARHFPTTLNPTLWMDYRPITLIPNGTFGSKSPAGGPSSTQHGFYHFGQDYFYISLRQPIELGHQTTHRYHIAKAAYDQQRWIVVQAELTALVQTYRFFQTAAYRREKYRLAQQLADFNDRLLKSLQQRRGANQVLADVVAMAQVETWATRQQVAAARQDYLTALTDLRNQIGIPDTAGAVEPFGEFTLPPYIPPVDEQAMIQEALANRPDIHAVQAQIAGTHSAVSLAKGDRIPSPVIGPQYEIDEAGVQYIGFVFITPIPIWNNGAPLVRQREAEHRRAVVAFQEAQQRATSQVRAAVARWNSATKLVNESSGLSQELSKAVAAMERLFDEGQTDSTRLMQARQRLIQLDNSRLDAVWAATQAQADLLLALGTPSLINAMLNQAERDAASGAPAPPPSSSAPGAGTVPALESAPASASALAPTPPPDPGAAPTAPAPNPPSRAAAPPGARP